MSSFLVEAQLKATGGSEFTEVFKNASNSVKGLEKIGSQVSGIGKSLTKGLTVPIVGIGVAATNTVMNFDDSMASVQKISGATKDEFADLREEAQRLGSTTAYSASEAADGMGVLAASGMETNAILGVSEDMFNLMSAGSIDAETSASILTNTMAQFNLEADDSEGIVNAFASGAASAKVGVDDLEHAMALAGGSLANMNMTTEESVAVMGQLANGAVPAEQLGSTVNAMSRDIIANADEMENFVDVYDSATGEMRGLDDILNDYAEATKNMTDEERNAAGQKVFTGKAQQGVNAWVNQGVEGYNDLTDSMDEMGNAAEIMAGIQEDTLGGSFRALSSATEGLMIEIGDVIKGPLGELAEKLAEMAGWFGGLSEGQKKMVVAIGLIVAAIGPVLMIIGSLISAVTAITGALALLTAPVILIIAGIAAVVAAGVLLYKNWDTIKEKLVQLKDSFLGFVDSLKEMFANAVESVKGFKDSAVETFTDMKDSVINKFKELANSFSETVSNIIGFFVDLKDGIVQKFKDVISSVVGFKDDIISGFSNIDLFSAGKDIIDGFIGGLKGTWEDGKEFVSGIGGWIKDNKGPASYDKKLLVGAGNLIMGGLNKGLTDSFGDVRDNVLGMGQAIQETLSADPTMNLGGDLAMASGQINSTVAHTLGDENSKEPQTINLNLGRRNYRAFVEDISSAQDSEIQLEESYSL